MHGMTIGWRTTKKMTCPTNLEKLPLGARNRDEPPHTHMHAFTAYNIHSRVDYKYIHKQTTAKLPRELYIFVGARCGARCQKQSEG